MGIQLELSPLLVGGILTGWGLDGIQNSNGFGIGNFCEFETVASFTKNKGDYSRSWAGFREQKLKENWIKIRAMIEGI